MTEIYITPNDDIQAIIDTSEPGDTMIFQPGRYILGETLRLKGDRSYVSQIEHEAVLVGAKRFDGPRMQITDLPYARTLFQRMISWLKRHILRIRERPRKSTVTPIIIFVEDANANISGFKMEGAMAMQNTPQI